MIFKLLCCCFCDFHCCQVFGRRTAHLTHRKAQKYGFISYYNVAVVVLDCWCLIALLSSFRQVHIKVGERPNVDLSFETESNVRGRSSFGLCLPGVIGSLVSILLSISLLSSSLLLLSLLREVPAKSWLDSGRFWSLEGELALVLGPPATGDWRRPQSAGEASEQYKQYVRSFIFSPACTLYSR